MNTQIKQLAQETLKKVPFRANTPDEWLNEYLVEYSRALIFACSDVVRDTAKEHEGDKKILLKSTAVDVLDHFGL